MLAKRNGADRGMGCQILKINPQYPQKRLIDKVVDSLRNGGLIAYPTDTTYGIGADLFNKKAVDKIYRLKPHKKNKMLAFICADLKDISRYAFVSDEAYRAMKKHLPGPYTFVLPAAREVPSLVMTKRKTVGIRVPDNDIAQAIVRELGNPIITTSTTRRENDIFDDPLEIRDSLGHALDYVIDGGLLPVEPSTVIDLSGLEPEVIREGKGDTAPFL